MVGFRLSFIIALLAMPAGFVGDAGALSFGTQVGPGAYDAVGRLAGCSATLITPTQVLTAAHCVCKDDKREVCAARATFELINVAPADDPATRFSESSTLATVKIPGTIRVHPDFSFPSWMLNDFAVLDLDYAAYTVAPGVQPIPLERPVIMPQLGETLWLIGHGHTGRDCKQARAKLLLAMTTTEVEWRAVRFTHKGLNACPGDSGGAVLNSAGRLVAVISWIGKETNTRPIHPSYNWITGGPRSNWSSCMWKDVGGSMSHQRGAAWCPTGYFLTQFDLDGARDYAAHDAPVVGGAVCCAVPYASPGWSQCRWVPVGAAKSLNPFDSWCPQGSYLTQFDLDGDRRLSAHDAPVVGYAHCCRLGPGAPQRWGSSSWQPVGFEKSHQRGGPWCPSGSFLTAVDLDGPRSYHAHDAPFVGRALCVRPYP